MENVLISLICLALVVVGTLTMMFNAFSSATSLADAVRVMEDTAATIRRTEVEIAAKNPNDIGGGDIEYYVTNTGQVDLESFEDWDVVAEYLGEDDAQHLTYVSYTAANPPGDNRWTVEGIYFPDNDPEAFNVGILDPGEKLKLIVDLQPRVKKQHDVKLTIATPNGVTAECLAHRR